MDKPRIGVFVCHCGINIGAYVDVPKVVEYAAGLPDVVHAERNLFTCSGEGISAIKKAIPQYNLNRVIVASCTPRTHEKLFRAACEEAGLNKYLFEFVNIRDQCSWVHMKEREKATQKAKDLIRMGIARARLLEPLEEIKVNVIPASLVIGGGIAGMNAALNLADQGFQVHLVEKENRLGGILQDIYKLFPTDEEASKLVNEIIRKVKANDKIDIHLGATVEDVRGFIGNFEVTLDHKAKQDDLKVGTIIVAVGADELKPGGQYGYGKLPNVITQQELELQLKKGTFAGQNVVIINCVGARVAERTYCSRFCCMTAVKNALLIREKNPQAKVWILHRDIMSYGVDFEDYYRRSMKEGVRYIRYDLEKPPQVVGGERCEKIKVWHQLMGREVDLPVDTLVLTTPLIPHGDNEQISKMLKVPLSEQGFFLEAHLKLMPVEFATDGIFICGSARWPSDVGECISQAYAAASKASIPMKVGYVKPEAITSSVNEDKCSGCGICEPLCPYNAIEFIVKGEKRVARCNEGLCKGCGTCGASCPAGAITMKHFTSAEIMAQLEALFTT